MKFSGRWWGITARSFELLLIGTALVVLFQHPVELTADFGGVLLIAVPLIALTVLFPVTLPSMLVSLELVFLFYFVLAYDVTTTLWVNFFGELIASLVLLRGTRKTTVLLNPAIKVICLLAGFWVFAALFSPSFTAQTGTVNAIAKLFTVGAVFYILNHLIINLMLFLESSHFNLKTCVEALRWEVLVYLVVFPLAFVGYVMHPFAGIWTLCILMVPVGIMTYLIRSFNRLQWANRINQSCLDLASSKELRSIYQETFQMAQEFTDSPNGLLLERQADGSYRAVDQEGKVYEQIAHPLLERAVAFNAVQIHQELQNIDWLLPGAEAKSMLLIPLAGQSKVFGIICLWKRSSHGFRKAHQDQLRFLASQVSIILDRNHVYEELERAAVTNQLTGLYNYQYFYDQLHQRFQAGDRSKKDLCLLIFDIDHFKTYNDIYGHMVGDEVLRQVAKVIRAVLEPHDLLLARYGGEEFVAIGRLNSQQALALAEQVRQKIETHQFSYQEHTVKNITISGGIAHQLEHDAISPSDLLEKADQALYWGAKEMGRNRIAQYMGEYDQRLFVDSQTGLYTMHYLRRKLRSLCDQEKNYPISFLLVDIRGLRQINERYGFEVGNQVLVDTAFVLRRTMRTDDLICRYLDDEFLVIVKGLTAKEVELVQARIQDACAGHAFSPANLLVACDIKVTQMNSSEEEASIFERIDGLRAHYDHDEQTS
ncbi:diguanylate cyclase [Tumebacillus lipolyticus]|uniref:Diguanylate cyclase n=1 Tax=Tumebacillus lipolyticus TaxID=1280370 RepID=A0ABW4ZZS6_9BACL